MEQPHKDGRDPVDAALLVLAAHAKVLLDLLRRQLDGEQRAGGWCRRSDRNALYGALFGDFV
jgi:hypothetical protein